MSSGSVNWILQLSGVMLTVVGGDGGGGDGEECGVGLLVVEGVDGTGTLEPMAMSVQGTCGREAPPRRGISKSAGTERAASLACALVVPIN